MWTPDWFERQLEEQGRRCLICGAKHGEGRYNRLVVDHDHAGGQIRGLLCHTCNLGLGTLRDDPSICRWAAAYLRAAIERGATPASTDWRKGEKRPMVRLPKGRVSACMAAQRGRCAICKEVTDLFRDHDHRTGEFRGLLCRGCNHGIGLFRDTPDICEVAAQYLEKRGTPTLLRHVRGLLARELWDRSD